MMRFASFAAMWHSSPKASANLRSSPGKRRSRRKVGLGGSGSNAHHHLRQKIYLVFLFGELTNIKPAAIPRRIT